jgi:hypothetical protein
MPRPFALVISKIPGRRARNAGFVKQAGGLKKSLKNGGQQPVHHVLLYAFSPTRVIFMLI